MSNELLVAITHTSRQTRAPNHSNASTEDNCAQPPTLAIFGQMANATITAPDTISKRLQLSHDLRGAMSLSKHAES